MKLRVLLSVIALPTILAACTTTAAPPMSDPQPPTPTPPSTASCNDANAQSMKGEVATPANVEKARVLAGARTVRVLKPGQMVTMEYIEGRLNIDVDAKNVIIGVRCG
jgi:hypothetical protein